MRAYLLIIFLFCGFSTVLAQDYSKQKEITQQVIEYFEGNQISEIYALFDDTMKSAISEQKLDEIWKSLPSQCGNYLGSGDAIASLVQGIVVVNQLLDFEKTDLDIRLAFSDRNKISGLYFVQPVKKK